MRIAPCPAPNAGPGTVVVAVSWAGICGSDIDLLNGTRPEGYVRYPVVPGHEWSGIVESIGDDVDPALVHKPVVGENIRSCGKCRPCREGNVCEGIYSEAGFTIDGAWADRMLVPANLLHVLPDNADLRSAAGIEPGACAATAVDRANIEPHHRVAVVGGGTIGMLCTQLARARGADVTVIDPRSWRKPIATACGASSLVDPELALLSVGGFDIVIEAAGAIGSIQMAVDLVRRGGIVVACGAAEAHDVLRSVDIMSKSLAMYGVFGATRHGWNVAVSEFVTGNLDPGVLVTHEFSLNEIGLALDVAASAGPTVGKVLLRP